MLLSDVLGELSIETVFLGLYVCESYVSDIVNSPESTFALRTHGKEVVMLFPCRGGHLGLSPPGCDRAMLLSERTFLPHAPVPAVC